MYNFVIIIQRLYSNLNASDYLFDNFKLRNQTVLVEFKTNRNNNKKGERNFLG